MRQENCVPSQKMNTRDNSKNGRKVANGLSPVQGTGNRD